MIGSYRGTKQLRELRSCRLVYFHELVCVRKTKYHSCHAIASKIIKAEKLCLTQEQHHILEKKYASIPSYGSRSQKGVIEVSKHFTVMRCKAIKAVGQVHYKT